MTIPPVSLPARFEVTLVRDDAELADLGGALGLLRGSHAPQPRFTLEVKHHGQTALRIEGCQVTMMGWDAAQVLTELVERANRPDDANRYGRTGQAS